MCFNVNYLKEEADHADIAYLDIEFENEGNIKHVGKIKLNTCHSYQILLVIR